MEKIELTIRKLGINGEGIGYVNRKAVFVDGAIPGETVEAIIDEDKTTYAIAHVSQVLKKSQFRIQPVCPIADKCGGCTLEHIDYKKSLEYKRELIMEALSKYSEVNPRSFEVKPTIGNENPFHYRNKASVPVLYDGEQIRAGLYEIKTKKLVYIDECLVHEERINEIIKQVLKVLDKNEIKAYNPKFKNGIVKNIVVRCGETAQVTLILNKDVDLSTIKEDILNIPLVNSFYTSYVDEPGIEIFGKEIKHIGGEKTIQMKVGDKVFNLLPNAFFQLNTKQTEVLYNEIKKAAKLSRKEIVLDAYCGVGTISKWVSKLALEVIGIDNNREAIFNANQNKEQNTRFICGDIKQVYPKLVKNDNDPDVVLVDPPRSGLGEEFIRLLLESKPLRIVYTSCNPSTLAKDIKMLLENYNIKYIQPIDMFPFTSHVESVCLLELKK